MAYIRPCRDCNELFTPNGKFSRFCNKCLKLRKNNKYPKDYPPCPFRNSNNCCVNKFMKERYCSYKQVVKCEIYKDWCKDIDKQKKIDSKGFKTHKNTKGGKVCDR